jgi:NAD(P)-dependent dehydrogenase (short-subunit alcohol dehydrogenase family)
MGSAMSLHSDLTLVTGADSAGMGRAIALALAEAGADVALHWYRDEAAAQALAGRIRGIGRRAIVLGADLGDAAAARVMVDQAVAALGGLGIVVCNAGMIQRKALLDITDADWTRLHEVNLHGTFAVAQQAARHMVAARAGGRIVMISSVNQAHANPDIAHYVASKGGIMMLGRAMALELAEHDITVNLVAPGTIETDINRHMLADPAFRARKLAGVPLRRAGMPDDVAGAVLYLASASAGYVTGATITVDGGLTIA